MTAPLSSKDSKKGFLRPKDGGDKDHIADVHRRGTLPLYTPCRCPVSLVKMHERKGNGIQKMRPLNEMLAMGKLSIFRRVIAIQLTIYHLSGHAKNKLRHAALLEQTKGFQL